MKLLLATTDRDYAEHLAEALTQKYADAFEVRVCSASECLEGLLSEETFDVVLFEPSRLSRTTWDSGSLPLILWSEEEKIPDNCIALKKIQKHQKISSIAGNILEAYEEATMRKGKAESVHEWERRQSKKDSSAGEWSVRILREDLDQKALQTILKERPAFVLPFRYKNIGDEIEFTYEMGDRIQLQARNDRRSAEEYARFWMGVLQPLAECTDWFMNPYGFVLQKDRLYDQENGQGVSYLYVPSKIPYSTEEDMQKMMTEMSQQQSTTDPILENKVLRAIMQNFRPQQFLEVLKSHQRQNLTQEMPDAEHRRCATTPTAETPSTEHRRCAATPTVETPSTEHRRCATTPTAETPDEESAFSKEAAPSPADGKAPYESSLPFNKNAAAALINRQNSWNSGDPQDIPWDIDVAISHSGEPQKAEENGFKEKTQGGGFQSAASDVIQRDAFEKNGRDDEFLRQENEDVDEIMLDAALYSLEIENQKGAEYQLPSMPEAMQSKAFNHTTPMDMEDVTQLDSEIGATGFRLVGDISLPRMIAVEMDKGQVFTIGRFDVSVGRAQSHFEFDKKTKAVSRRHAAIERKAEGYYILDLNSSAGTYLNGQKLLPNLPYKLERGSRVSFGNAGADYIWDNE